MTKQIFRLCRLQLGNLFGINELRYTKDKGKRARFIGLSIVWIMLIIMAVGYVAAFSYGLASMEMVEIVPMYLYAVASLLILIFSFFKAGNTLFAMKGYEMLISLPVSRASIIISRFACMYLMNLLMELIIMIPGLVVYGYFATPSVAVYVVFLLGSLFLPLLPLTISSVLGAVITAISSRTRHKSLVETVLMLIVVIGALGGSLFLSDNESQFTEVMLKNMAETLSVQIGGMYPPSIWFQNALSGDLGSLGLLLGIPTVIFVAFVAILQKYFQMICAAIHAVSAKNNYKMTKLQRSSHITALWHKELKRYFASSIYVTNTVVGYVMAVLVSAGILFMGIGQIEAALGIPDIGPVIIKCLPFGLSCLLCMTSISACSISMEGNTFWQIQTLPVTAKEFYDSKILANLSVAAPFYLVSVILLGLAVKPSAWELIWLLVIPDCYVIFSCVVGITVNLTFPVLKWDNEVRIVKQSASMLVTMLVGVISSILPLLVVVFTGEALAGFISLLTVVILLAVTCFLYKRNQRMELIRISER
ncbi:MAG: hypothetical protein MR531_17375 [Lachnospiraceae bacterium]|nr:hypothetical protein [Lachnospiraceae bacterium]